ncbi:stalk-specific protein X [Caulobacter sp. RHG1]|uniref:stalk-specific protein StpX n=1 Tax=Caulobacter sp. (strain RHG1) TaxID=2545762 RepID=UPI00271497F5|nr:stalk-specific protein X [Caulobacter sp. RHG1]NQE60314.1 hypothetical protein [Caulobacter sp. RHG1]
MFERNMRLAALTTAATAALLLAGCSGGEPVDTPPPASDYHAEVDHSRADAPDLMGAAPAPDASQAQDGLLGGPGYQPGRVAERPLPPPGQQNAHLKTWRRPDGTLVTAMRPIANPKGASRTEQPRRHYAQKPQAQPHRVYASIPAKPAPQPAYKPAPVAQKPVAKPPVIANAKPITPKTVAPAPAPIQAAKPVQPATPLAKPPVVAAVPVVPAKPASKLEQLQAAVAPEATAGAVLAAGESLSKNQPGQVTLSLPVTLGDRIKEEAAKLGLGKAARKTSAYANLEGQGYEITPNGRQTAVVKPGEPTTFAWQVKPGPEAKGQIRSQFGVELNGTKQPQGFALGEISKRVFTLPEKAKSSFGALKGLNGKVSLPGVGDVSLKTVLGVALVLLALIILVGVSRNAAASRRRAERQRKYRTLTDYGRNEMEFEDPKPASANVSYVNPFVAAAGGAAVGAVAASAFSNHDNNHGRDSQGHDAHGHQPFANHDAGHGADHGHTAHDDHAHHAQAHPEPHAPAEHVSYVNPMVAAAAAPAPAAHDHDDHGDHDHPLQAPAAHDDHGHHAKKPEPAH